MSTGGGRQTSLGGFFRGGRGTLDNQGRRGADGGGGSGLGAAGEGTNGGGQAGEVRAWAAQAGASAVFLGDTIKLVEDHVSLKKGAGPTQLIRKGKWPLNNDLTAYPPDPIVDHETSGSLGLLSPDRFYIRPVKVWAPELAFPEALHQKCAPCPNCNAREGHKHKGWTNPSKVVDLDGWYWLISRR